MILWSFFLVNFVFILGFYGLIINRSNLIQILICFEILLLCLLLNFSISIYINLNLFSLIISILITVIAASESAIGLTIIVFFYKLRGSISPKNIISLKL